MADLSGGIKGKAFIIDRSGARASIKAGPEAPLCFDFVF